MKPLTLEAKQNNEDVISGAEEKIKSARQLLDEGDECVEHDSWSAVKCYQQIIDQFADDKNAKIEVSRAYCRLGWYAYTRGQGGELKDPQMAESYYLKSIELGNYSQAKINLVYLYLNRIKDSFDCISNQEVAQNYLSKAKHWLDSVKSQDKASNDKITSLEARYNKIAKMVETRDSNDISALLECAEAHFDNGDDNNYSEESRKTEDNFAIRAYLKIVMSEEKIRALYPQEVRQAFSRLGNCYATGVGVKVNDAIAERYYLVAANLGNPYAMRMIISRYLSRARMGASCWLDEKEPQKEEKISEREKEQNTQDCVREARKWLDTLTVTEEKLTESQKIEKDAEIHELRMRCLLIGARTEDEINTGIKWCLRIIEEEWLRKNKTREDSPLLNNYIDLMEKALYDSGENSLHIKCKIDPSLQELGKAILRTYTIGVCCNGGKSLGAYLVGGRYFHLKNYTEAMWLALCMVTMKRRLTLTVFRL